VLPRKLQPIEIDNRRELKKKRHCIYLPPLARQDGSTFKLQQLQQSNSLKRLQISAKMKRTPSAGSLGSGVKNVTWCSSLKIDPLRPLTASPKKGLGVGRIDFDF
jgi:hypothetical protein